MQSRGKIQKKCSIIPREHVELSQCVATINQDANWCIVLFGVVPISLTEDDIKV